MSFVLNTRDSVFLDGIALSAYGMTVEMPQPIPIAKPRYTIWTSGERDFSEPDDSFEDIEYTLKVRCFKSPSNFRKPEFYAACVQARTLMLSRHVGRHYRIRRLVSITPTATAHGNDIAYSITFALAPFAYHNDNPETDVTEARKIVNPGTRYSRPIYKLRHSISGETILSVNGELCFITADAPNPLYIDTERMLVYDDEGMNKTRYTRGSFPFLASGQNLLSCYTYTGGGLQRFFDLSVIGNWRDY